MATAFIRPITRYVRKWFKRTFRGKKMVNDVIYDRFGTPMLRLLSDGDFIGFNGARHGFLYQQGVYNYSSQQVGWYENGILRDLRGFVVGFGRNPSDFPQPILPFRRANPSWLWPHPIRTRPLINLPHRPNKSYTWSSILPVTLFNRY